MINLDHIIILLTAILSNVLGDSSTQRSFGQTCDPDEDPLFEMWHNNILVPEKYLYCDKTIRQLLAAHCPVVQGQQRHFDQWSQRCVAPKKRDKRQNFSSGFVGSFCNQNIDCVDQRSMYCVNGRCTCLSGYVAINSYCQAVVNPGQSGCGGRTELCRAAWADTTCSGDVCQCGTGYYAQQTRDGTVCIQAGGCPLPSDAGTLSQLTYAAGTSPVACTVNSPCTNPASGESLIDTYDCIPSSQNSAAGICCPNRAFACIMPPTGGGGGSIRWYYNSVSGGCQQFTWGNTATLGNANNFNTIEQCMSYCGTMCQRGVFQYNGIALTSSQSSCSSASCSSDYSCSNIGSSRYCCMLKTNICANRGGLTNPSAGTAAINGIQGTVFTTTTSRWRYDSTQRTCVSFSWWYQAGDYNNFQSQSDCLSYCGSVLCAQGDPITDANGRNQACSSNSNCPPSHTCTNSVCCPTRQTVCTMEKRPGSCNSVANRYWYNPNTKECELFQFTGCNGNGNNFATLLDCQAYCRNTEPKPNCIQGEPYRNPSSNAYITSCSTTGIIGTSTCPTNYECYFDGFLFGCCPIQSYVCGQSNFDRGVACGPQTTRWYYDTTLRSCSTFTYLGCGGNPNNFVNRELCETYCGVGGCPYGGQPFREGGNSAIRICDAVSVICPQGYDCQQVTIGSQSANRCCPSRGYICQSPPNSGDTCGDSITRWYFNQATRTCLSFTFNGCGSNGNNFATKAQCDDFCESSACNLGEIAYTNPSTNQLQTCNRALTNSCPTGFTCSYDSLSQQSVCCGATDMGVCPAGQKSFIDPLTYSPRTCLPSVSGTGGCPGSFLCRLSNAVIGSTVGYYCCASAGGTRCPLGKVLYQAVSGAAFLSVCQLNSVVNVCPTGYSCQTSVAGSLEGYCCSIQTACPNGGDFQKGTNEVPNVCSVGSSFISCGSGYTCQQSPVNPGSVTGYCCSGTGSVAGSVCGPDRNAFLVSNNPQACNQFSFGQCSLGYSCIQSPVQVGNYYCCSPSVNEVCTFGLTAERLSTTTGPRSCSIGIPNACSTGYTCTQYQNSGSFFCCGSGVITSRSNCPAGLVGLIPLGSTVVQSCSGPGAFCQTGYTCQWSQTTNTWACCGQQAGCPVGSVADIDSLTGQLRSCTFPGQSAGCNVGFTCTTTTSGNICCTTSASTPITGTPDLQCPQGMAAMTDSFGNPQSCTSCPVGYSCQSAGVSQACCPTSAATVCNLPLQVGGFCAGKTASTRYFYDINSRQCSSFTYNGCSGNGNNFFSQASCQTFCAITTPVVQQQCPVAGQMAYNFPGTTQVVTCSPSSFGVGSGACPNGYTCQQSPLLGLFICCGSGAVVQPQPTVLTCPVPGQQPYLIPLGNQVQTCTPGSFVNPCPTGYTCQAAASSFSSFICCGSALSVNPQTCPTGSNVYLSPATSTPLVCTFNMNVCPSNYRCQYSNALREYYCCSGTGVFGGNVVIGTTGGINGCPTGSPYMYPGTGTPLVCPANSNSCPNGYRCLPSTGNTYWQCCTSARRRRDANTTSWTDHVLSFFGLHEAFISTTANR